MHKINRILNIAETAGKIILENGGEVYRVEETIAIICSTYSINVVESFVTPSVVMISIKDKDGNPITFIKRIKNRTINFKKIDKVNSLSRKIFKEKPPLETIEKELADIDQTDAYSDKKVIFFSGVITGCFTIIFGGAIPDFIVSFILGCVIRLTVMSLSKIEMNDFFVNILGGGLATFVALMCSLIGLTQNTNEIIIGSIMLLVPGLSITNGLRDTIAGDLFSGITRTIEAVFVAIAIALGSAIIFQLYFFIFGGI